MNDIHAVHLRGSMMAMWQNLYEERCDDLELSAVQLRIRGDLPQPRLERPYTTFADRDYDGRHRRP